MLIDSGKGGYVYAVNAQTGSLLWKTPVGEHNGHDNDSVLALEHKLQLTAPFTIEPGELGGVLSNPAVAGGTVYVSTVDEPIIYSKLTAILGSGIIHPPTGEFEALNLASGQGRVGHQAAADGARRRDRVQQPRLHHPL